MDKKWINVMVKVPGDPDGGGLLDQLEPPQDYNRGANIYVKGRYWSIIDVAGNLLEGPGEIFVKK